MKIKILLLGLLVLLLALASGFATAQEVTTGSIEGDVRDPEGNPLPGVSVTLGTPTGDRTEMTDGTGHYRFPFVVPGKVSVQALLDGYITVEQKDIDIRLGSRVRVDVILTPGTAETMEITGSSATVDISTATTGASISTALMTSVPVGRNFASTLALAPGVVDSGIDKSNPSISGASGLENTYVVDGVNINNTGYGSAGSYSLIEGYGALGTGVNFDYIQEVQVKTGGYEPEFGEALGGFVNLITKSGTNEFNGSVFTYWQPRDLEGDRSNFDDRIHATVDTVDYNSFDFGGNIGGPIVKDKAFFFGAVDPQYTQRTRRTAKAIRDAQGFDWIYEPKRDIFNYAANVKWFPAANHTVSFSAFGDPGNGDMTAQRDAAFSTATPELRFSEIKFGGNNMSGRWTGEIMKNWYFEGAVGYHNDKFEEIPKLADFPSGTDRRTPVWTRYGGFGYYEAKTESKNMQYRAKLSNFFKGMGEHNLRYGLEVQDIDWDSTATYSGIPGLELPGGKTATTGFSWYIPPSTAGVPDEFRISRIRSSDPTVATKSRYTALYAYDGWNPTPYFNIMAGVRWERDTLIGRNAEHTWSGNWAPRFHVTYDPTKDNRTKLSFAWGRFFGKIPNDLAVRSLSVEETWTLKYLLSQVDLSNPNQPVISGAPFEYSQLGGEPTIIEPDSKVTMQDEIVAGFQRELVKDFSLGVNYTHRSLSRTLEDKTPNAYSFLIANPDAPFNYTIGTPKAPLFPDPVRKYDSLTFSADKRFSDNWQFLGSYTYARLRGNYEGYYRRDNGQSDPLITSLYDFAYLATAVDRAVWANTIGSGPLPNDRKHVLNLYGSYAFDFKLNMGVGMRVQSGNPLTKLGWNLYYDNGGEILVEPRGASGRGDTVSNFDMHFDYPVKVAGASLGLIFDVFNLFNTQNGIDYYYDYESGGVVNPTPGLVDPDGNPLTPCPDCLDPDFGKITTFQDPRQFRFAARFTF